MLLCLIILFIILYKSLSQNGNEQAAKKRFTIIATTSLFLVSALRHEAVGNDTFACMMTFESFSDSWTDIFRKFLLYYLSPTNAEKDPGYLIFIKLCSIITNSGRVFIAIVSAITLTSVGFFIYRNAKTIKAVFFSFVMYSVLFFQYIPNSATRQSLAIVMLLIAYESLKNKRYFYSVVCILIASTFHKTSLIGFIFLAVCFFDNVKFMARASLIVFSIILLFPTQIASFLGSGSDVYSAYGTGEYYTRASRPYMVILLMLGLYVICLLILKHDSKVCENKMYYYGAMFTFVLTPLVWSDPSILRLLSYFGLYVPILIGDNIMSLKYGKLMFSSIIVIFFLKVVSTPNNYHFMWQEMQLHDRYGYMQKDKNTQKLDTDTYYFPNLRQNA